MESIVSKKDQLRLIIRELETLGLSDDAHFAIRKADDLDEFIQANEQGIIDFAKSLLNALLTKEGTYGLLDYDAVSVGSDVNPTYVEFGSKKPTRVTNKKRKYRILNFALYLVGLGISVVCLAIGAYTIVDYFF